MKDNLLHFLNYCKKEILPILAIILLAFGSFGLGRLSVENEPKSKVVLSDGGERVLASVEKIGNKNNAVEELGGGEVVASKNSDKYHFSWCPGASKISPNNLITFKSEEEAIKAGFTKALNCK